MANNMKKFRIDSLQIEISPNFRLIALKLRPWGTHETEEFYGITYSKFATHTHLLRRRYFHTNKKLIKSEQNLAGTYFFKLTSQTSLQWRLAFSVSRKKKIDELYSGGQKTLARAPNLPSIFLRMCK